MNCWFSQTPRLHPSDFATRSRYGVAHDWPLSYDDLEPYYCQAEQIMSIAGDPDMARVLPRSQPFPQPPHKGTAIDMIMKEAMPDHHFIMPTGRARVVTGQRGVCCANASCNLCPVNAKFTAQNGLASLFGDLRVDVCLRAEVRTLEYQGDSITAAHLRSEEGEFRVQGDVFVLGANAIQSPAVLLRSDIDEGDTGRGLHEQVGANVEVYLDSLGNFDGSTITTGLNYALYDGDFRREHSACLVYFENRWPYGLRPERGRWNELLPLMLVSEDLPNPDSRVRIDSATGDAVIDYQGESDYGCKGVQFGLEHLETLLAPLPVESIHFRERRLTESHVQGTLRMGQAGDGSVVDGQMRHHRMRNLVVVGTSTYPSCSPANPSLTAAAFSIRAADLMFGQGGHETAYLRARLGRRPGGIRAGFRGRVFEDRQVFIPRLLEHLVGPFRMGPEDESRFIEALVNRYGEERLRALIGLYKIRQQTGLGTPYTDAKVDRFERGLLTDFMLSTDFLRQQESDPKVVFLGYRLPCSNPYARFDG